MTRASNIEALIERSRKDFAGLKKSYEASLQEQVVHASLKVDIKNIFENLRSCLDYLSQEIFDAFCKNAKKPKQLYFPIRSTAAEFMQEIKRSYPGLESTCTAVFEVLESMQPFQDPWLGQFNDLNNENKHQDLVEQTKTEVRRVTVARPEGTVSWGSAVKFGSGVSVMGVPIDPRSQLPVPNRLVTTSVAVWVDFKFRENGLSVVPFVETSIDRVESAYRAIAKYC